MTLFELTTQMLERFNSDAAPSNQFIFGLVTPLEQVSVCFKKVSVSLEPHVKYAEYLLYAPLEDFAVLLNPTAAGRLELIARLEMRPDYPFHQYLLSIFLGAFDLIPEGLDCTAKRMEGFFPFPPRYPSAENPFRIDAKPKLIKTKSNEQTPPNRRGEHEVRPVTASEPQLPQLIAEDHPEWLAVWEFAWQRTKANFRIPEPQSGFVAPFMDTAFNDNTFMWDSVFMTMYGRYARRAFDAMGTLENFYAKQHDDGFICREINTYSGLDVFQSLDPRSTGPNLLAWAEWQGYQQTHHKQRLEQVFPVLIAYQRWCKDWRTHQNGTYWTSGWGSGMDNQVRVPNSEFHHRHHVWLDANLQAVLNNRVLLEMAQVIGRDEFNHELQSELEFLTKYINQHMWDEQSGFYYDAAPDGSLGKVKSIGAFWALLAGVVPLERLGRFVAHLEDKTTFKRRHRVPTQSADSEGYNPHGGYWLGSVWSPTNYMVLQGLTATGFDDLAFEIAKNHLENVCEVFKQTGTLWENYAPDHLVHGRPAGRDFVGWTGLSAISIPIEYLIGLRWQNDTLHWDVRLLERHGILRYPVADADVDLICLSRASADAPIRLEMTIGTVLKLSVRGHVFELEIGNHTLEVQ